MEPDRVTVFTDFIVPLSVEIYDDGGDSDLDRKWAPVINAFVKHPGHRYSSWGRIVDRREHVLLVIVWRTPQALAEFRASPSYAVYMAGISAVAPPLVREVAFPPTSWTTHLCHPGIDVRTIYFRAPVTAAARQIIGKTRGLTTRGAYGMSVGHLSEKYCSPAKAWVLGTETGAPEAIGGQAQAEGSEKVEQGDGAGAIRVSGGKKEIEMEVLIWLHFWVNAEIEEQFKRVAVHTHDDTFKTERVVDMWDIGLKQQL